MEEKKQPQKFAIIGLPGSGKSTFANKLGNILNIRVHHLDLYIFDGTTKRDHKENLSLQQAMVDEKSWVAEGCSIKTLEMRYSQADVVIYFQLPRLQCIWRLVKRLSPKNKELSKTGCLMGINWELMKYLWNFEKNKWPDIEAMKNKYPSVEFHIFQNSKEADRYLNNVTKSHSNL